MAHFKQHLRIYCILFSFLSEIIFLMNYEMELVLMEIELTFLFKFTVRTP